MRASVGWQRWRLLAGAIVVAAGCTAPVAPEHTSDAATEDTAAETVFVYSNGWHTGIAIAASDVPSGRLPETRDFPDARYLAFGWGDAAYYPARDATAAMGLRAALSPSPAVLHVAALDRPPDAYFPETEVIAVALTEDGFARLIAGIDASFDRQGQLRATATEPGLYRNSGFYPATGQFHLFNTCNTWTARVLAGAGHPVTPSGTITADDLMRQLRR